MNAMTRLTAGPVPTVLAIALTLLVWSTGPAQVSRGAPEGLRVAQAAVEKAKEAARLATEQASEAGQQRTDHGDVVNPSGDVYIARDETVNGDVIAISGAARVHGKVEGNVVAIGGSVFLPNGSDVAGDVVSFGGTITREPGATVRGSTLQLPGVETDKGAPEPAAGPPAEPVTQKPPPEPAGEAEPAEGPSDEEEAQPVAPTRHRAEIVQFGQPVRVAADEFIDGGVVSIGGPVDIGGEVKGDVVSMGGPVDVGGKVHGDVVAIGGPLSLNDGAEVHGDAVTLGGPLNAAQGAKVNGQTVTVGGPLGGVPWGIIGKMMGQGRHAGAVHPFLSPWVRVVGGAAAWLGQSLVMLILVALVVLVFPRQTETIAATIGREPGRALVYGLVSWLLVLPILFILFVLIITWILVPVYLLVLVALLALGYVGVSQFLGGRIVELCKWRVTSLLGLTLVGFVALSLVDLGGFLPFVRYMAAIVTVAVLVFALGGALMTRFGTDPSGTWLGGRAAKSPGAPSPPAVPGAAHAAGRVEPGPAGDESLPASDPTAPADDDFDDATRRALKEVEECEQPEPAERSEQPTEPPIDDLGEAARQALAELPPENDSEEPQSPPAEGEPREPES